VSIDCSRDPARHGCWSSRLPIQSEPGFREASLRGGRAFCVRVQTKRASSGKSRELGKCPAVLSPREARRSRISHDSLPQGPCRSSSNVLGDSLLDQASFPISPSHWSLSTDSCRIHRTRPEVLTCGGSLIMCWISAYPDESEWKYSTSPLLFP
jgi:hypothetical protein